MDMKEISQVGFIFLGWLFGIATMLIARWLQAKEERRNKEIDIISGSLKFLFEARQMSNNLRLDKMLVEKSRTEFPQKTKELERELFTRFDKEMEKDFFPALMFQSFQLKRLKDKTLWKDFEALMNKLDDVVKMSIGQMDDTNLLAANSEVMTLQKKFIDKCLAKTRV